MVAFWIPKRQPPMLRRPQGLRGRENPASCSVTLCKDGRFFSFLSHQYFCYAIADSLEQEKS